MKCKTYVIAVIGAALFFCSVVTGPKIPEQIPRQQIRDSIGAARFASNQEVRP